MQMLYTERYLVGRLSYLGNQFMQKQWSGPFLTTPRTSFKMPTKPLFNTNLFGKSSNSKSDRHDYNHHIACALQNEQLTLYKHKMY